MSAAFADVLARTVSTGDGFTVQVPPTWHQGRTAYGGFSAALAIDAAMRLGGADLPPLRSAAVSFVGPLAGEVAVAARLLRQGRNATWIGVEIAADGKVGLTATLAFMGPVNSALHLNDQPPPEGLIPFADAAPFAFSEHSPLFLRHNFEVRFALSRGGGRRNEMCSWVRLAERAGLDPMTELVLIADALPPGILPLLAPGVPISSMNWQANLLTPRPATTDGWWLLRSCGDYAEDGCSSQRMAIWNAAGEPVMAGMQAVAIFG